MVIDVEGVVIRVGEAVVVKDVSAFARNSQPSVDVNQKAKFSRDSALR